MIVVVLWLFLTVPYVGLQCVIVVFPDYNHLFFYQCGNIYNTILSYDVASGSEITLCNKIDQPLVVYRFTGNVMTSITTLRT